MMRKQEKKIQEYEEMIRKVKSTTVSLSAQLNVPQIPSNLTPGVYCETAGDFQLCFLVSETIPDQYIAKFPEAALGLLTRLQRRDH